MRNTSDEYTSKRTFLARALFSKDNTQRGEKKERRGRERKKNRGVSPTRRRFAQSDAPPTIICSSASTWRYPAVTPRVCSRKEREREKEREVVFVSDPFYEEKREREGQNAVKKHPRFPRKKPRNAREREKAARRRFSLLASRPFRFLRASTNTARALLKFSKTLLDRKEF